MRTQILALFLVLAFLTAPAFSAVSDEVPGTPSPVAPLPEEAYADLADGARLLGRVSDTAPAVLLTDLLEDAGVLDNGWSIGLYHQRTSPLGTHLRYEFVHSDRALFGHEATLHLDTDGQAWFASQNVKRSLPVPIGDATITTADAVAAARAKVDHPAATIADAQLGWSLFDSQVIPVWQIDVIVPPETLDPRDVRIQVDARDGAILSLEERLVHAREGSGWVFPVSPMVAAQDYNMSDLPLGPDTPEMLDHIHEMPFEGLSDAPADTGRLVGAYATVLGTAVSPIDTYLYPRTTLEFQEAMSYWHTDQLQRKIQSLGFFDVNNESQLVAASNVPGLANAFFFPAGDLIVFGSHGGTFANGDAAEDPEVIIHENGHAIQHDQVPSWGGYDQGAMGEGFGDFLGAAVLAEASEGFGLSCVAEWWTSHIYVRDPPCLRMMHNEYTYSEIGFYPIHSAGQLWSGHLYDIAQNTSWDTALALSLAGHHLTHGGTSMAESSDLLILADRELNDGRNEVFIAQNAYDREIAGPLALEILGLGGGGGGGGAPDVTYDSEAIPTRAVDTSDWSNLLLSDDQLGSISIPETRFFGASHETLYVSSNGFIGFDPSSSGCCSGQPIPAAGSPDAIVAGLWTDLNPGNGGRIAYHTTADQTSVNFENVAYFGGGGGTVSFRIDITTDGVVEVHLFHADGGQTTSTGIESPDGQWGVELRRTSSGLPSPEAWRLMPVGDLIVPGNWTYLVEDAPAAPVDITGWTSIDLLDDDVVTLEIPQTRFYDLNTTTLHVASNGFVSFAPDAPDDGCCTGGTLPSADGIDGLIAPLWTDLDPKRCGTVAYNTSDGSLRVAYVGVPYYGSDCGAEGATATFWFAIDGHGNIDMHLLEAAGGVNATTGIEAVNGTAGNLTRHSDAAIGSPIGWRFSLVRLAEPEPEPEPEPDPVEPSTEAHHFTGRIGCGASAAAIQANDLCSSLGDGSDTRFAFPIARGATGVHVEVTWAAESDHPAEELQLTWAGPMGLPGVAGGSPLVLDHEIAQDLYWIDSGANATAVIGLGRDQGFVMDQAFSICIVMQYGGADLPTDPCAAPAD